MYKKGEYRMYESYYGMCTKDIHKFLIRNVHINLRIAVQRVLLDNLRSNCNDVQMATKGTGLYEER